MCPSGSRPRDRRVADRAAGPAPVLHHHGLAEEPLERCRDRAGREVGLAARRERHDHRDGAGGSQRCLRGDAGPDEAPRPAGGRGRAGDRGVSSSRSSIAARQATGFSSTPMPVTSIRTTSPGFRYFGGLKPIPTPAGVPVAIRSPGSSVMPARDRLDQRRDVEDQVGDRRVLPQLAVDVGAQPQARRIRDLVRRDDHRPHRAEPVHALADEPLPVASAGACGPSRR